MADLPSDKVDEAKQVFEVFDKKYEVRILSYEFFLFYLCFCNIKRVK
jgi:hypothetical protein